MLNSTLIQPALGSASGNHASRRDPFISDVCNSVVQLNPLNIKFSIDLFLFDRLVFLSAVPSSTNKPPPGKPAYSGVIRF